MKSPGTLVALLVIGVDIGLARLGYGLLLPAIRHDLGGSYALYGAIGAVHLVGYLAGTVWAPWFLRDRARLPQVTAATHALVAGAFAWSAAARDPGMLCAARALLGLASGVGVASAINDALERVPAARRGAASGLAWSGIGIGLAVSAPAGAWTLGVSGAWRGATLLAMLPAAAIVALALRLPKRLAPAAGAPGGGFRWRDLLAPRNVFFVVSYGGYGVAYIAYATFAVAAFAARGISHFAVSGIWAAFGVASVLGARTIGRVLAGPLHRWSMALPLATGAVGSLVSALPSIGGAICGALCVGSGLAAAPAVASIFARDRSDARSYAHAFAGVTTVFGAGQIIGPLVAGAAADAFGLDSVPVFAAAVFGAATLCAAIDARIRVGHPAAFAEAP